MHRIGTNGHGTGRLTRREILGGCAAVAAVGALPFVAAAQEATPTARSSQATEAEMAEPRVLMSGIALGESPRWHEGGLWFADWMAQEVIAADLAGKSEVILQMPSFPFSFDWLPDGPMLIVSGDGQLQRREPEGSLAAYADLSGLSEYPWNEIVVDGRGNAYVNNIGFDFLEGETPPSVEGGLGGSAPGIVALVTPDGAVRQVAEGVAFPNGMVVTPDNATLILAESYGNALTAFDITEDGSLTNRRVWADVGDGAPDGITLDADGAVWYGDVPNMRCVRVREGGEVLQTIELDRGCFACMLGGEDGKTLFMLAADWEGMGEGAPSGQLLSVDAPAAGAGWP